MFVEAGLVAFSSARFEFADEVPEEAQRGSLSLVCINSSNLLLIVTLYQYSIVILIQRNAFMLIDTKNTTSRHTVSCLLSPDVIKDDVMLSRMMSCYQG